MEVGKSVTQSFDLSNTGNLLLTLTKAAPPTAPFLVPSPVSEGQPIEPGDTIPQSVTFAPTKAGAFTGSYVITGNDGQGAQTVDFTGYGVVTPKVGTINGLGNKCLDIRSASQDRGHGRAALHLQRLAGPELDVPRRRHHPGLSRCLDVAGSATTKNDEGPDRALQRPREPGLDVRGRHGLGPREHRLGPVPRHPGRQAGRPGSSCRSTTATGAHAQRWSLPG